MATDPAGLAAELQRKGISDPRVLAAVALVPRERFVPPAYRDLAYHDEALPIGAGQTISQPFVVASMTAALGLEGHEKVLEIGTGSGYQAALLSLLAAEVFSVERLPALLAGAAEALASLPLQQPHLRLGDGFDGWPEAAPFDAIVVTAAPAEVPEALLRQLAPGGRLVVPVGREGGEQRLLRIERGPDGALRSRELMSVRFVPLVHGVAGFSVV